jgi:DNA polymerase III subunit beta
MKFSADKSIILENAQSAERAVPSGTAPLPVLSALLFEVDDNNNKVTIRGTDLDFGVTTTFAATVDSGGSFCVNARMFTGILKSLRSGVVTIDVDTAKASMQISSGQSNFELRIVNANEFPSGAKFDTKDEFTVDGGKLTAALKRVVGATSSDNNRPMLMGVNFSVKNKSLRLAATDSYRLAVAELSGLAGGFDDDTSLTIPGKALEELIKFVGTQKVDVGIILSDRSVRFRVGATLMFARLIEGTFPAYDKLMVVAEKYTANFVAEELVGTVKRVQLVNEANASIPVRFDFEEESALVSCSKLDVGAADERVAVALQPVVDDDAEDMDVNEVAADDDDDAQSDEPIFSIGFNPRYMVESLNAFGDGKITFHMDNEIKPVLLTSDKVPELRYILMPVRLT